MNLTQQIIEMIANANPALTASQTLAAEPTASVKKLIDGCAITFGALSESRGLSSGLQLTFDQQTRLTRATWSHIFPDLDRSSPVFRDLLAGARQALIVRPNQHVIVASKKVKGEMTYHWKSADHDSLILTWAQPKARAEQRLVSLERRFRQPHAAIAAEPRSDPG